MDHVRLDAAALKPAREPEAVAAGFVGDGDAGDGTPRLDGFTAPALQQAEQLFGVGVHLLLGMALDARDQTGHEPTLLTHLDHDYQSAMLIKGGEGSTHIVCTGCHGASPSASPAMRMPRPRRRPIASQDRQGAWSRSANVDPAARRRGDRIAVRHMSETHQLQTCLPEP